MDLMQLVSGALREDLGDGDHTSLATIPDRAEGVARLLIKSDGILAGIWVAREVFRQVDPSVTLTVLRQDGDRVVPGDEAFWVKGRVRSILAAERTVLNFMQRLSGIATQTDEMVKAIEGTGAMVLDTRKTTPLLRQLEKEAVRLGGGANHRMGLYDMIMIKDNHVDYAGGITGAILATERYQQQQGSELKVEIEVRTMEELQEVLATGKVHRIMFDNFLPGDVALAVKLVDGRYETEASGGITRANILAYAETGVDFISLGSLTHQIASLDMSLKAR